MSEETKFKDFTLETHTGPLMQKHQFTEEEMESLRSLLHSTSWKNYQRVLAISRQGHNAALLASDSGEKALKTAGIVVGLDLAMNQLGVLVSQFEKKAKRVAEESKNQPQP